MRYSTGLQFAYYRTGIWGGYLVTDERIWKLHVTQTRGQPIEFTGTKQEAIDYCARVHGTVIFTDTKQGFIFYKTHD